MTNLPQKQPISKKFRSVFTLDPSVGGTLRRISTSKPMSLFLHQAVNGDELIEFDAADGNKRRST